MRKLILKMSMSINGFVGGPEGELDWMLAGDHGGSKAWQLERAWDASLHIMGRKTFNDMKKAWPTSDDAYAAPMNAIPKAYFSRSGAQNERPESPMQTDHQGNIKSWNEAHCLSGDLSAAIQKLKDEEGKPIIAWGGAGFARSLVPTGLIDEYQFLVHPAVLPAGLEIFSKLEAPLKLELVSLKPFENGVVAKAFHAAPS